MAAKHASIKLSRDLVDDARRHAETMHRSVGAQVEHWARMGRLYENSPGVTVNQVRAALERGRKLEDMTAEDSQAFFRDMGDFFKSPDQATIDAYAAIGLQEGAVGTDGRGGVIQRTAAGKVRKIR
jgi:hypothetical protein